MADDLTTDDDAPPDARESGLVAALGNLTDGIANLVRNQFELARLEFRYEAAEAGSRGARLVAGLGLALVGYGFSLLAVVFGVGWWFGRGAMALGALGVGVAHLAFGLLYARAHAEKFEEQRERIEQKTRMLTGTESWPEENPDN